MATSLLCLLFVFVFITLPCAGGVTTPAALIYEEGGAAVVDADALVIQKDYVLEVGAYETDEDVPGKMCYMLAGFESSHGIELSPYPEQPEERDQPQQIFYLILGAIGLIFFCFVILAILIIGLNILHTLPAVPEDHPPTVVWTNELPVILYKPSPSLSGVDEDCCIWLGVYEDGDALKQMPCHHACHATCLDTWLSKHRTCPLCRTPVC